MIYIKYIKPWSLWIMMAEKLEEYVPLECSGSISLGEVWGRVWLQLPTEARWGESHTGSSWCFYYWLEQSDISCEPHKHWTRSRAVWRVACRAERILTKKSVGKLLKVGAMPGWQWNCMKSVGKWLIHFREWCIVQNSTKEILEEPIKIPLERELARGGLT